MSNEITTAAELDALPYHSTAISIERYVVVQRCADGLWRTPGMTDAFTTTRLIDWGLAPFAVLWRPDRPVQPTVLPDLETLALVVHQGWQGYECTCGLDDLGPVERETVTRVAGAVLDAIRGERP